MAVKFTCDGCGREEPGFFNRFGDAFKPPDWFIRTDDDGTQVACSRRCIAKVSEKTDKTAVVAPI